MTEEKRSIMSYIGVGKENESLFKSIYFAFFVSGLTAIAIGLILPYLKAENNLTYEQTSLFLSANQIGNLMATFLVGFLPFAIGRKQSTLLIGSGIALGMLLIAITKNPTFLLVAFILAGVGRGTMTNICNVTISQYSTNKGMALNVLHAIFATGAVFAPVLMLLSIKMNFSFRLCAITISALAFIVLFLLGISKLSTKKEEKQTSGTWGFVNNFQFWLDTMVLFCYLCAETSIIGWFVIYFYDLGILPEVVCNFTPSILWLMIMFGRLFCASISTKVDRNKLLFIMGLGLVAFFGLLLKSQTAIVAIVALAGIGFSMAGIYPTTVSTMKGTDNTIQMGFTLSFASLAGIFMPKIVGSVADERGISAGIFTVFIALIVMMILISIKWLLSVKNK